MISTHWIQIKYNHLRANLFQRAPFHSENLHEELKGFLLWDGPSGSSSFPQGFRTLYKFRTLFVWGKNWLFNNKSSQNKDSSYSFYEEKLLLIIWLLLLKILLSSLPPSSSHHRRSHCHYDKQLFESEADSNETIIEWLWQRFITRTFTEN